MSPVIIIGGLFEAGILVLWWASRRRMKQKRAQRATAMEREIADLRHALTEMAMENHRSQETRKQRKR